MIRRVQDKLAGLDFHNDEPYDVDKQVNLLIQQVRSNGEQRPVNVSFSIPSILLCEVIDGGISGETAARLPPVLCGGAILFQEQNLMEKKNKPRVHMLPR